MTNTGQVPTLNHPFNVGDKWNLCKVYALLLSLLLLLSGL